MVSVRQWENPEKRTFFGPRLGHMMTKANASSYSVDYVCLFHLVAFSGPTGEGDEGSYSRPAAPTRAAPAPRPAPSAKSGGGFDDMEDDIPF